MTNLEKQRYEKSPRASPKPPLVAPLNTSKSTSDLTPSPTQLVGKGGRRLTLGDSSPQGVPFPPPRVTQLAATFNRMDEEARSEVKAVRTVRKMTLPRSYR